MISKYGKPVDRSEWGMEPQTYNAYYNPSNNEICIPGLILLFLAMKEKWLTTPFLYSIIGVTFGHEITHGFDDQVVSIMHLVSQNWWTTEDSIRFYTKTK